jgi:hypothetical protein
MLVYLARCPGSSCDGWNADKGAVWFKIAQYGLKPGAPNLLFPNWLQGALIPSNRISGRDTNGGSTQWTPSGLDTVIPKDLKPGAYLIRHELFNYGTKPGEAQSFPNCAQLMIEGEGTKLPSDKYLVSFPGAYKPDGKTLLILWFCA